MAKSLRNPETLKFIEDKDSAEEPKIILEEKSFLKQEKEMGLHVLDMKQKQEIIEGLTQDREERKKYARWVFLLIIGWLISDLIIVFFAGWKWLELSDTVLITLITTTTGSVIAIFYM